jgi:hypothetical protein
VIKLEQILNIDDEDEFVMKVVCVCPVVSAVPDLVGGDEEEHRGVEAGAHLLLPLPVLHLPHLVQVGSVCIVL